MKNSYKLFILLILWAFVFIPVYPDLVNTWLNHSNNSHGALVPLISIFLGWQKRHRLYELPIKPSNFGGMILITSMLVYTFSYLGSVAVVSRIMIVSSLIGLVLFNYGAKVFSVLKFPLFYLVFMVPVPSSIYSFVALPLQIFATKISAFLLNIFLIPVHQEGTMLYFSQTQLEVAEQCSGLQSMMSFIMLSVLFAYMMNNSFRKRLIIILSAIPLAIFANIIRVTGTGVLANYYGSEIARGFLHEFSGLVVFALGFLLLAIEYSFLNGPRNDTDLS